MILKGKVAIVTGGSKGIGRGIALRLAREGANVVINCSRDVDAAENVCKEIQSLGVESISVKADVSKSRDVENLVKRTTKKFNRIDILVNNAAKFNEKSCLDTCETDWDEVIDTNLKGTFLCSQAVGREMIKRKSGCIVNISTLGAQMVVPGMVAYIASKGGIEVLTRALACEWAKYNIRVNGVAPGHIATEDNIKLFRKNRMMLKRMLLNRLGEIGEVSEVVLFLVSDASKYIVGQIIYVEGGIISWQGI